LFRVSHPLWDISVRHPRVRVRVSWVRVRKLGLDTPFSVTYPMSDLGLGTHFSVSHPPLDIRVRVRQPLGSPTLCQSHPLWDIRVRVSVSHAIPSWTLGLGFRLGSAISWVMVRVRVSHLLLDIKVRYVNKGPGLGPMPGHQEWQDPQELRQPIVYNEYRGIWWSKEV
jgi:hypothetical protein